VTVRGGAGWVRGVRRNAGLQDARPGQVDGPGAAAGHYHLSDRRLVLSVAALGLAGLTLAIRATASAERLSTLIGACVLRLRAEYATRGVHCGRLGLILAGAVVARTALTRHDRLSRRRAAGTAGTRKPPG